MRLRARLRALRRWKSRNISTRDAHRSVIGNRALFFGVISGFALYYAFVWNLDYAIDLAIWFAFWLSVFHFYYARNRRLTTRSTKQIDYWYLSIAAIGVLFFAVNYGDQRVEYLGQYEKKAAEVDVTNTLSFIRRAVSDYTKVTCALPSVSKMECEAAQDVFKSTRGSLTVEMVEVLKSNFAKSVEVEKRKGFSTDKEDGGYSRYDRFIRMVGVRDASESAFEKMGHYDAIPTWQPLSKNGPDFFRLVLGLGQAVLWPFILALALALRLTKVTIEAEGWAN